jgi:iron complex transport system permease protein
VSVSLVLAGLAFAVFCWSLTVGDFPVPLGDVLATLFGGGSDDGDFVVRTLRLPRSLVALMVGAGFGLSGAIFQRLTGNPLASPDIIGVTAGSSVTAVYAIVTWQATRYQVTAAAVGGGLVVTLAIYLLAYRRGVTGYRLVLVGIGMSEALRAVIHLLLTRAEVLEARRATVWLTGSLNGRGWEHVRPLALALLVLIPPTLILARQLRYLDLGDDTAKGLGVRVERARLSLLVCGVGLAAVCTAAVGPVGFVALVCPHIARRLVGPRSLGLVPAAAFGALLVVGSDLVARRLFAPSELPVGIVTAVLGAPYLLYLLARTNKIGKGG